jgi:hypothetical protein
VQDAVGFGFTEIVTPTVPPPFTVPLASVAVNQVVGQLLDASTLVETLTEMLPLPLAEMKGALSVITFEINELAEAYSTDAGTGVRPVTAQTPGVEPKTRLNKPNKNGETGRCMQFALHQRIDEFHIVSLTDDGAHDCRVHDC